MSIEAWHEVARAARLTLAHVIPEHVTGTTFHSLRREMAHATWPSPSQLTMPWLHGVHRDVAVIVRTSAMRQVGEARQGALTHTSAIAEIDPPLFAGLRLFSRGLIAFFGPPAHAEITAHPSLDTRFIATAFDMSRVREILLPHGLPDRLGEGIAQAERSCNLLIKDSAVEALALGATPDLDRVEALVDIATSLAREISARARNLRQSPLEISGRESWQKLAASLESLGRPAPLAHVRVARRRASERDARRLTARRVDDVPRSIPLAPRVWAAPAARLSRQGRLGLSGSRPLFALQAHDKAGARALFADAAAAPQAHRGGGAPRTSCSTKARSSSAAAASRARVRLAAASSRWSPSSIG